MTVRPSFIGVRQVAAAIAAAALVVFGVPLGFGAALSAARADATAETVTGSNFAWDWVNNAALDSLPTATVSQTQNLVDQTVHVTWSGESASNNSDYDPTPTPGVTFVNQSTIYGVGVYECRGAAPKSLSDCYLTTDGSTIGSHGLGNAVQTVTQPDGTGFADVHIETGVDNDLLGCDSRHACSVAVVPAWGGLQQSTRPADCNNHADDFANAANDYNPPAFYAETQFINAGNCSWTNRLVVPLHFAPTPTDCPRGHSAISVGGSPMLLRAMQQWRAGWCRGSDALSFDYNSTTNEYQARSAFTGGSGALTASTDVALVSQPADTAGGGRFTYAPIANTDIAIAFVIDDQSTGKVIPNITLDARLVAKMLTQSYAPLNFACLDGVTTRQSTTCDPAVRGNPSSILADPEFRSLNPQLSDANFPVAGGDSNGAFFPTVVSGNSDLIYELTRWVDSDADARAFLKGQVDPWGMRINSYYKGIQYPTSALQGLDPGFVDPSAPAGNGTMQNAWQPISGLENVGTLLAGNTSTALNPPILGDDGNYRVPKITEPYGARDLFAIMDQAQAAAYALPTAHLINAGGRAVAPTTDSVTTALSAMTRNPDGITRRADYASKSADAYPLSIVDYAMVRTCGYTAAKSTAVASLLSKVAQSQLYGTSPGTIAPGYLALTEAQLRQVAKAAQLVSSRPCASGSSRPTSRPSGSTPLPGHGAGANGNHTTRGTSGNNGLGSAGGGGGGGGSGSGGRTTVNPTGGGNTRGGSAGRTTPAQTQKSSSAATAGSTQAAFRLKHADSAGLLKYALPLLLIVGGLLLLGGPAAYLAARTKFGAALAKRLGR